MANLRITELDFDGIKENIKDFLQDQAEFQDYDFEGSGLSVLLDILSYNTHMNAYLANQLVNEMFLDSAVKRSSAVSIAKHLGYIPRSAVGASAVLNITVNNPTGTPATLTLERYTPFNTTINGTSFTFLNPEAITIEPTNGVYTFPNVRVKEGQIYNYSHSVNSPGPDEKYEIPNDNVDISSLRVRVQTSSIDTSEETYTNATEIFDIDGDSKIFYVEENSQGRYQIFFGDGILGKKLSSGNIVRIEYLISSGTAANVSRTIQQSFSVAAPIGGSTDISISVVSNSTGGGDKENISSLKFNAPRYYSSKNRAVTKHDYDVLIKSNYPDVKSISVWGGEENIPPVYGKVFISLKPFEGFEIDDSVKLRIRNEILNTRKVLTTITEFVDPDYLYVKMDVSINYDKKQTTLTSSQISTLANDAIRSYFFNELEQFNKNFYHSDLVEILNNIEPSILSVILGISLQKRILPVLNTNNTYTGVTAIHFNNKLHPSEFRSTLFYIVDIGVTVPVNIKDVPDEMPPNYDGTGTLYLYNTDTGQRIRSIGTINYSTGDVEISNLNIVGFPANQFDIRLTCSIQENSVNIVPKRNQIIVIDDSSLNDTSYRESGLSINSIAV